MKNGVTLHSKIIAFTGLSLMIVVAWIYLMMMAGHSMPANNMGSASHYSVGLLVSMWVAMSIAMMLPTAVPMISAYMEICQTAATKSIATVSPLVLIAGYLSVWLAFAISAAIAQVGFLQLLVLYPVPPATGQAGISLLVTAVGVYQFTGLKQACLTKCRAPLNFFFANWSDNPRNIFQLGVKQGVFCLGCCWALMLLMFVTGIMDILWMVALTVLMVAEKTIPSPDILRRITGFALIAWGATLAVELL